MPSKNKVSYSSEGFGPNPSGFEPVATLVRFLEAAKALPKSHYVRFPDGQVGEIQMWPPGMLDAKEKGGGHHLYEKWRTLDPNSTEAGAINQQMVDLYAKVEEALPSQWKTLFRKSG